MQTSVRRLFLFVSCVSCGKVYIGRLRSRVLPAFRNNYRHSVIWPRCSPYRIVLSCRTLDGGSGGVGREPRSGGLTAFWRVIVFGGAPGSCHVRRRATRTHAHARARTRARPRVYLFRANVCGTSCILRSAAPPAITPSWRFNVSLVCELCEQTCSREAAQTFNISLPRVAERAEIGGFFYSRRKLENRRAREFRSRVISSDDRAPVSYIDYRWR